jgi:hypothetical protein
VPAHPSLQPYSATDHTKYGKHARKCPGDAYCTNCMPLKVRCAGSSCFLPGGCNLTGRPICLAGCWLAFVLLRLSFQLSMLCLMLALITVRLYAEKPALQPAGAPVFRSGQVVLAT